MNGQEERSNLILINNGSNGHGHFDAPAQQSTKSKLATLLNFLFKHVTLHRIIYISGLYILFSKTKSRCTPPKAFEVEDYTIPTSSDVNDSMYRIPKIIHQSYKSLSTLPKIWADTPSRWKEFHPSYEYKFWSDDDNRNLIATHYPWFLETYDNYPAPIQRADAARYFAVLHHGGIYADMDILPIRNVDPLLWKLSQPENEDKEMIVAETYNLGLTNALFASIPNSTILHQFVQELPQHTRPLYGFEFLIPHFHVLLSTGPTRLWIYLNQYRSKILTLNPAGWGQCHQCKQKHCEPVDGSFFETTKGGSWHKWDTRIMNFIFCHVHFCIWGGVCVLLSIYYNCLAKRRSVASSRSHSNGVDFSENKDPEQGLTYVTGKNRKWNATSTFDSFGNFFFVMKVHSSKYRFPLFCVLILLLVL